MSLDLMEFFQEIIYLKIKDGTYIINLDEYAVTGTNWIALFCTEIEVIYFDSFGVEHVPKETEKFMKHKKHKNKHIQNTIKQFNNAWILLHWVY